MLVKNCLEIMDTTIRFVRTGTALFPKVLFHRLYRTHTRRPRSTEKIKNVFLTNFSYLALILDIIRAPTAYHIDPYEIFLLIKQSAIALIVSSTTLALAFGQLPNVRSLPTYVAQEKLTDLPYHEQVIKNLRAKSETQLIPWAPDVHPVTAVYNREAVIPPQCYTKTEGVNNPCYVCHQNHIAGRENTMNDGGLQAAYSFSDLGMKNHWKNLFEDRSARVREISDSEIRRWINVDNYSDLGKNLRKTDFNGWIPDIKNLHKASAAFDDEGFAKDGSHWVAFNYKPLPSTFWPTNGSTDDVMIRLPEKFRTNPHGKYNRSIYMTNLSLLEAAIKGVNRISTPPIDEKVIGVDLNGDKQFGVVEEVDIQKRFVGAASVVPLHSHLYPVGTEFLHTLRYVNVDKKGNIGPSKRLKEVRYMKKWKLFGKPLYARYYEEESFDKEAGNLPGYQYLGDKGLDNGFGWSVQSFLEDVNGELRVATYDENLSCMGCHKSVGSTIDKTFSFARKVDGVDGWGYIDLRGMPDAPNMGETEGEILTYFRRAGGGDEFRSNMEMFSKWFNADGSVNTEKVKAADVYELTAPSPERAIALNKAYKTIVEDQDFIYGKEARLRAPHNVYEFIDNETAPTLLPEHIYEWDIRLDWKKEQVDSPVANSQSADTGAGRRKDG